LDNQELKGIVGEAAFKAADSDHDGTLSKADYLALVNRLFKQADANHDGTLDAQELGSKTGHKLKLLID
jgi:Ca2+-binding EF-hand superfamily protein